MVDYKKCVCISADLMHAILVNAQININNMINKLNCDAESCGKGSHEYILYKSCVEAQKNILQDVKAIYDEDILHCGEIIIVAQNTTKTN